jgi:hypothetical protein
VRRKKNPSHPATSRCRLARRRRRFRHLAAAALAVLSVLGLAFLTEFGQALGRAVARWLGL